MSAGRAPHAPTVHPRCDPGPAADLVSREGASMKRSMAVPTAGAAAVMLLALTVGCSSSRSSSSASDLGPAADLVSREGASMKRSMAVPTAGAAAVMLLALTVGCSSSSSSSSASGGSTTGGSTSGKSYKLSFIQGVAGDGFYVTMGCGMQAEAKKLGNVTVNIQGPTQFDPTLQNPIIESVTAAKPDAIMIAPDDVTASRT